MTARRAGLAVLALAVPALPVSSIPQQELSRTAENATLLRQELDELRIKYEHLYKNVVQQGETLRRQDSSTALAVEAVVNTTIFQDVLQGGDVALVWMTVVEQDAWGPNATSFDDSSEELIAMHTLRFMRRRRRGNGSRQRSRLPHLIVVSEGVAVST